MNNSEEFLIFKNIVFSWLMWGMCMVSCLCIGLHILDSSYKWYDIPPLVILGGRSITYFWCAIQYQKILKNVKDINNGGKIE